jgi:hypothetical protein
MTTTTSHWPDPWPKTDEEVRRWRICDPYERYFQNRANVVERLFDQDLQSIDAIALAVVSLGALAEFRFAPEMPKEARRDKDQYCFRRLLTEHCTSFLNRVSIPELLRATRTDPQFAAFEAPVKAKYPVARFYQVREVGEDPLVADFTAWADANCPGVPRQYDYAGCIHRHYRNAVIHELRVAGGREAGYFGNVEEDGPIYYVNGPHDDDPELDAADQLMQADPVEYIRFGVYPPYLLALLREAIVSVRGWALANDRDLFGIAGDD